MDNNNNPNSPNNPPNPWAPPSPTPPSDNPIPQPPVSPYLDPLSQGQPTSPSPTFDPNPPAPPNPTPMQPEPTPFSQPPPVQLEPTPIQPEPTWQPPTPESPKAPEPSASGLDNPWGAPAQVPPLDGEQQTEPVSQSQADIAPTDLSHLINNDNPTPDIQPTPPMAGEALAPQQSPTNAEIPSLPNETPHGGIPKWVIGLGVGLFIVVAGASAYFILGVGQPPKTTSIPATVTTQRSVAPAPVSQPSTTPVATGSSTFGELEGTGTKAATTAGDLLRQGR